jgi:hypothetical protein
MKKISLLLTGVLFCTLVSARGTDETVNAISSVAVTNAFGSTLFKLYYKSIKQETVRVSISDEKGEMVFKETIKKVEGFMRPYNFEGLAEGQYFIQIEDESGKRVEKVNYKSGKAEQLIHVQKLSNDENKYLLTIASAKEENVFIKIYDVDGTLVHYEAQSIAGEFAQVYDLNKVKSFTIEVTGKDGLLKSVTY